MIKLKNINKKNNTIICDVFPEDSKECGCIVFDIETKSVVNCTLPNGYEWCTIHIAHASKAIEKMIVTNNIPDEKLVMWY